MRMGGDSICMNFRGIYMAGLLMIVYRNDVLRVGLNIYQTHLRLPAHYIYLPNQVKYLSSDLFISFHLQFPSARAAKPLIRYSTSYQYRTIQKVH